MKDELARIEEDLELARMDLKEAFNCYLISPTGEIVGTLERKMQIYENLSMHARVLRRVMDL